MVNEAKLTPISTSDKRFDDICNRVYESYKNSCICSISEVVNEQLLNTFEAYVKNNDSKIIENFHGTLHSNLYSIMNDGFKSELNITSAYGIGTYTAKNARYSFSYMKDTDSIGISYMFLCQIAIIKQGLYNTDADTTVNSVENPTIFVTKNDVAIYPKYLISFYKNASFE